VIILDTNVISELARIDPEPGVVTWLDSLPAAEVATTAITAAELLYGVARLPDGRRRAALAETIDARRRQREKGATHQHGGCSDRRHLPRVQRNAGHP
jgi:predicted nucleic acid-binding protein